MDTTETEEQMNRQALLTQTADQHSPLEQTTHGLRTNEESKPETEPNAQSHENRRSVLRKAAGAVAALTLGIGASSGTTTADSVEVGDLNLDPAVAKEAEGVLDVETATDVEIDAFHQACSGTLICHEPPGNPGEEKLLCIGSPATNHHFQQHPGDRPGARGCN